LAALRLPARSNITKGGSFNQTLANASRSLPVRDKLLDRVAVPLCELLVQGAESLGRFLLKFRGGSLIAKYAWCNYNAVSFLLIIMMQIHDNDNNRLPRTAQFFARFGEPDAILVQIISSY
jgi:hypothetical protein